MWRGVKEGRGQGWEGVQLPDSLMYEAVLQSAESPGEYQSILNAKLTGRKNLGWKRCTSNRDDCKLENTVKQS